MISPENLTNVYDRSVTTNQIVSAIQFNTQITLPQSHMLARRQGLYTVQPMQINVSGSEWNVDQLSGSYYRTHGYWSTGSASPGSSTFQDLLDDGDIIQRYAGSMRKVGTDTTTIHAAHDVYYNEGPTGRSFPIQVESFVSQSYTYSGLKSPDSVGMETQFSSSIGARGFTTSIDSNVYIPTEYMALYGDLKPFQFTTRDLVSPNYYLSRPQPYSTTRVSGSSSGTLGYKFYTISRGEQRIGPISGTNFSNTSNPLYYCPAFAAYPYADEEI